jgi:hypothetical protein
VFKYPIAFADRGANSLDDVRFLNGCVFHLCSQFGAPE